MSDPLKVWDCIGQPMSAEKEKELLTVKEQPVDINWAETKDLDTKLHSLELKCFEHRRCPCTLCKRVLAETVTEAQQILRQNQEPEGQSIVFQTEPPHTEKQQMCPWDIRSLCAKFQVCSTNCL